MIILKLLSNFKAIQLSKLIKNLHGETINNLCQVEAKLSSCLHNSVNHRIPWFYLISCKMIVKFQEYNVKFIIKTEY